MGAKRIFVAGHNGMVGRALCRTLSADSEVELLTVEKAQLDLTDQSAVRHFFKTNAVDEVYLAAAKVGGIHANQHYPASFILDNLLISANVIAAAHEADVNKLMYLGSSCIYPKYASQPIVESELLKGHLEPTNEPYAIAKIAGIKLCESFNRQYQRDYRCVMPTNLYGPYDNFELISSHVIPALINKFYIAKSTRAESVNIWGSGNARREFLHVDDLSEGVVAVSELPRSVLQSGVQDMMSHINIGTGTDITIKALANTLREISGFDGELVFDTSKPEGTPIKRLDIGLISSLTNWRPKIALHAGLVQTWEWFNQHNDKCRV